MHSNSNSEKKKNRIILPFRNLLQSLETYLIEKRVVGHIYTVLHLAEQEPHLTHHADEMVADEFGGVRSVVAIKHAHAVKQIAPRDDLHCEKRKNRSEQSAEKNAKRSGKNSIFIRSRHLLPINRMSPISPIRTIWSSMVGRRPTVSAKPTRTRRGSAFTCSNAAAWPESEKRDSERRATNQETQSLRFRKIYIFFSSAIFLSFIQSHQAYPVRQSLSSIWARRPSASAQHAHGIACQCSD